MATVVKTTFQLKRGTAAKWVELNLVLAAGEPGFEIDTKRLKIGDGTTAWLDLPYIGENGVVNAATHYDFPETGAANIIYKAEDEKLLYQWNSSTQAYEILGMGGEGAGILVDTELSDSSMNAIANSVVTKALQDLEAKIPSVPSYTFGEGIRVEEIDGIQIISIDTDFIHQLIPEVDLSGYLTESDLAGLATEEFVLRKIAEAQLSNGDVDLSNYYTKEEVDAKIPVVEGFATLEYVDNKVNYLVLPEENVKVDYGNKEIRINAQHVVLKDQVVGANGDADAFYLGIRAYAPAAAESFKEGIAQQVEDQVFTFSDAAAGIDEFGRKYSIIWLPIGRKNAEGIWENYSDKSTVDKCLGWYYSVEWYDADNQIIETDCIRIVLTNDACHNYLIPDEISRKINSISSDITNLLETNYITIEQGVTKEELTTEVRTVVTTEVEDIIDNKISEGVSVNQIDYGSF